MKQIVSILIILTTFYSCMTDVKDNLGIPEYPDKLVLNCFFTTDSAWLLQLEHTNPIVGLINQKVIDKANVIMTDKAGTLFTFEHLSNGMYTLNGFPKLSEEYTINADCEGYESVSSHDVMPRFKIKIDYSSLTDSIEVDSIGNYKSRLEIAFNDEEKERNYYELLIFQKDSAGIGHLITFKTSDMLIESPPLDQEIGALINEYRYALFSDDSFNGNRFELGMSLQKHYEDEPLYVHLKSCSKNYFDYQMAYTKYAGANEDPFFEPISAFSNIVNGYGVFAAYVSDQDTLK